MRRLMIDSEDRVGYMLGVASDDKVVYEDMYGCLFTDETQYVQLLDRETKIARAAWIKQIFDIHRGVESMALFTVDEASVAMFLSNMTHFTFDECRVTRHGPHFSIRLYA